ncbi:MAG: NYN domain-containing protein [Candidatus Omnitrophica bacterium]|nr:NYN domain-containing protein [Candidatus Omnitrophota bacterium]
MLKQMAAFKDMPLEEGRARFLSWISNEQPQGSINNPVMVVFDGNSDFFGSSQAIRGIKVVFSAGCCADDTIRRLVEEDADKKNCVVVSNDKEVYLYARSLGARVMSVADFTKKTPKRVRGPVMTEGKYIPLSHQEKINKELRGFWLKEK